MFETNRNPSINGLAETRLQLVLSKNTPITGPI